jgi:hypothetical protein
MSTYKQATFSRTQVQESFRSCFCSYNVIATKNRWFCECSYTIIGYRSTGIFTAIRTETSFTGCSLDAVLSCSLFELKKPTSQGLEPRTLFWSCCFCSYNIFGETKVSVLALFFHRFQFPRHRIHLQFGPKVG